MGSNCHRFSFSGIGDQSYEMFHNCNSVSYAHRASSYISNYARPLERQSRRARCYSTTFSGLSTLGKAWPSAPPIPSSVDMIGVMVTFLDCDEADPSCSN